MSLFELRHRKRQFQIVDFPIFSFLMHWYSIRIDISGNFGYLVEFSGRYPEKSANLVELLCYLRDSVILGRYRMLPLCKCCQSQFSVPNEGSVIN